MHPMTKPNHAMYDDLLKDMEQSSSVSKNVLARVLVRVMISAPQTVARADIAKGTMLAKPSTLNQSAVSKAVACLAEHGLVTQYNYRSDPEERAGRPIIPLSLGSSTWALMGITVVHKDDKPVKLHGVVTDMRVDKDLSFLAELERPLEDVTFSTVADNIKQLHDDLLSALTTPRKLFGVGVGVASHVDEGVVIGATHVGLSTGETFDLLTPLQDLLQVPVVIDNDVNLLAVRQTYKPQAERHVSVIAVLNDGVGGSLIIDGHVYRGGGGMAAEPGHQTVINLPKLPSPERLNTNGWGFDHPCHCGMPSHVDCYAVPTRLTAELGTTLAEAGRKPARDPSSGQLTRPASVFRTGGEALGQGIAGVINTVNPSRVVLILPGDLARADTQTQDAMGSKGDDEIVGRAEPGTAAAEYLEGVEAAVTAYSFSRGAVDARAGGRRLTVQVLNPAQIDQQSALCAAIRILDAFVMHALERDRCHELAADGTRPPTS